MKQTLYPYLRKKAAFGTQAFFGLLLLTDAAFAKSVTNTYFRFRTTAVRQEQGIVQLSEFQLFNSAISATSPLTLTSAADTTNDVSGDGAPTNAIDGNYGSKWLNFHYKTGFLVVGFDSPTTIDSYNYVTGNDSSDRDPVSWVLESSDSLTGPWTPIDIEKNFVPNSARSAIASASNLNLPASLPGYVANFSLDDPNEPGNIYKNGSSVTLDVDAGGSSVTLTSSAGGSPVAVTGSSVTVTPPANALTTYTVTAQGTGGSDSKSLQIRTVAAPTLTYRYIRYTPTKVVSGTTIDLDDFEFNLDGTPVTVSAVENPGGNAVFYPVGNLIDDPNNFGTDFEGVISPVIFDFGTSPVSYNGYSFTTGWVFEENPLQWTIEGSNDKTTWTLVQNVNFDFTTPPPNHTESGNIPFDGTSTVPAITLTGSPNVTVAGEPVTLTYSILGATSGTITPGPIALTTTSGTKTVNPTTTTTYTLTATSPSGVSATATYSQTVFTSLPTSFTYTNFNDSSLIKTVGTAYVLNDFANYTAAGNVKRLRLTDNVGSQQGAAWYAAPMVLKNGFDTSYDAFIAKSDSQLGADGLGFVVQNAPTGLSTLNNGQVHISTNAVSIALDAYPDVTGESGYANLELWKDDTMVAIQNLPALNLAHGANTYLADYNNPAANPYHMRVVYVAPATAGGSGSMTVYVDGTKVIDSFAITLEDAGAVDGNGRSYLGFVARTGGFSEVQDVTAWSITTPAATGTTPAPKVTSYTFNTSTNTATLNYSAVSGKSYRVTSSTDLTTWTQVSGTSNTTATSTSGTFTFTYTPVAKAFYRIELLNP